MLINSLLLFGDGHLMSYLKGKSTEGILKKECVKEIYRP
jgi:hypothetical protein